MTEFRWLTGTAQWNPKPHVYAAGLPPLPDETLDAYLIRVERWLLFGTPSTSEDRDRE